MAVNKMAKAIRIKKKSKKNSTTAKVGGMLRQARKEAAQMISNIKSQPVRMSQPTTITTAPVSIGNSVRGAESVVRSTKNGGILVTGRDFMFTPIGTTTVTGWKLVGGTPLAPAAFADSTIRQYLQLYQKYRWKGIRAYYITSSPTSSSGDVMFYHGKNRSSVFLNQTSNTLLPMVISDPDTVLGPQWVNHVADLHVQGTWKSTDYGMSDNVDSFSEGELFLLSKTDSTESPGYVMFDYVIEFAELQLSPRLLTLPLPRAQYNNVNIGLTTTAVAAGNNIFCIVKGNGLSGSASALPTGYTPGDVYKLIIDVTNSNPVSWTNSTVANLIDFKTAGTYSTFTIVDGVTIYAVVDNTGVVMLCENPTQAFAGTSTLVYGITATVTYNLQCWMSLIGTINAANVTPNY